MVQITTDDVRGLAQLSALALSEDEVAALTSDIQTILTYVNKLDELDTADVQPTYHVNGLHNVWRDDEIVVSDVSREQLLALAPEQQSNAIKVPKVL